MNEQQKITVLKFGSSVLGSALDLDLAVEEIYRHRRLGHPVVVVVSAYRGVTDRLITEARERHGEDDERGVAAYLARGEQATVTALCSALETAGIPARAGEPREIGLRARGPVLDSAPVSLDIAALRARLDETAVLVLPGFLGWHEDETTALFGRGGSDLSALFVAQRLRAGRCILVKDTRGVYDSDPNVAGSRARRFERLSFHDALAIDGRVIQRKALHFALINRVRFELRSVAEDGGTLISELDSVFADDPAPTPPLRVALYGHGQIGSALRARLERQPERWQLVGVCVRDLARHPELSRDLGVENIESLDERRADVVVELIGGSGAAAEVLEGAIERGRDIVTANKELLAERGEVLVQEANLGGTRLRYSAAVGGSVPVLETIAAIGAERIRSVRAILNGTSNRVLELLAEAPGLERALAIARREGLAEADPSDDLDGRDALRKLVLLSRRLRGRDPDRAVLGESISTLAAPGPGLKQVATLEEVAGELVASVDLVEVEDEVFLSCRGAGNAVILEGRDEERFVLRGLGAGPRPTVEALMADLLDLRRERGRQLRPVEEGAGA